MKNQGCLSIPFKLISSKTNYFTPFLFTYMNMKRANQHICNFMFMLFILK